MRLVEGDTVNDKLYESASSIIDSGEPLAI